MLSPNLTSSKININHTINVPVGFGDGEHELERGVCLEWAFVVKIKIV
jgi:hypothetical protein